MPLDAPGYIDPYSQEMMLTDITEDFLQSVAFEMEVEYLSPAPTFPGLFPATGVIFGYNHRPMINLACRKQGTDNPPLNVIFLVNTGSPASYLSAKAMEALNTPDSKIRKSEYVMIHTKNVTQCYLSPPDKNFVNVNVLGAG